MKNIIMEFPIVEAQYGSTFIYYANIVTTIIFMLVHPVLLLFLYDMFNGYNVTTIIWSVSEFFLAIYSIFLSVSNETLQIIMLTAQHYVKGYTLMMLILNVAMWM